MILFNGSDTRCLFVYARHRVSHLRNFILAAFKLCLIRQCEIGHLRWSFQFCWHVHALALVSFVCVRVCVCVQFSQFLDHCCNARRSDCAVNRTLFACCNCNIVPTCVCVIVTAPYSRICRYILLYSNWNDVCAMTMLPGIILIESVIEITLINNPGSGKHTK